MAMPGKPRTSFTSETARAAALKRHEDEANRAVTAKAAFSEKRMLAKAMVGMLPREELGDLAFAAANKLATDLITGAIVVRNAGEAAQAIRALVEVGRLEKGESVTGESAVSEERKSAIRDFVDELEARRKAKAAEAKPAAADG